MAFTPILNNQPISYVISNSHYRNSARESLAGGSPVFFVPTNASLNDYGYGGPKYKYGYTYYNCPTPDSNYNGNCTWWCWGRLNETMGTYLPNYGDAANWYSRYTGSKETNANNINPGDIIVFSDGGAGHVMFVEQVSGNTIYISHSAYSTRSVWSGRACIVNNYQKSEISAGLSIDMYKNTGSAYYVTVVGVLHTGGSTPPTPTTTPSVTVSPSSYTSILPSTDTYIDFQFTVTVTGIPSGETASGNNTYPGLTRVQNSGWSYTDYTVSGVTYRRATKTQTLRYTREQSTAYTTTKYMYYSFSYPNGSASSTTPMYITVQAQDEDIEYLYPFLIKNRNKRKHVRIKLKQRP